MVAIRLSKIRLKQPGIGFNPRLMPLKSDAGLFFYLKEFHLWMGPGISVKQCTRSVNFMVAPPAGGIYFSPMVLFLRAHFPLSPFIQGMLEYYQFTLT